MMTKRRSIAKRRIAALAWVLALLCLAADAGMALAYRSRALPNTHLGNMDISGRQLSAAAAAPSAAILPARLELTKDAVRTQMTPAQLGVSADAAASLRNMDTLRRRLPLASLVIRYNVPLRLRIAPGVFRQATGLLAKTFSQPAAPEHITLNGSALAVIPAKSGYALDTPRLTAALTDALQSGSSVISTPTTAVAAPANTINLAANLRQLQRQLGTTLHFVYRGQDVQPSKADIGGWFVPSGQTMAPSPAAARRYADKLSRQLGIGIANPDDLAAAAVYAVSKNLPRSFAVVSAGGSTIARTYCTAVRGVDPSVLADLAGKLAVTYNDVRGWNNGGRIAFQQVDSGCQYTVWMSTASQMAGFGTICDAYYSCEAGSNVVLNYDRWTSGTDPWNKTGGSIEDYRTLMIDHETGHRLGFLDNPTCPGAGQPAPVMMQQSMNLKGCVFNIWPRPAEFAQLDTMLGLPAVSAVSE